MAIKSKDKKKVLQQYGHICKRVEELTARKQEILSRITALSPKMSGMPSGTPDGTKTELIIEQLDKIQDQLSAELKELYALEKKILSAIRNLSDVRERRILTVVYIGKNENGKQRQLSLWQAANEMGYSYDRVRHIHGEALMHLKI